MTIIVLLLAAAVGVAGLLYRWSAGLDDAPPAPLSLSYPLFSPKQWTQATAEADVTEMDDVDDVDDVDDIADDDFSSDIEDDAAASPFTLPYSIQSLKSPPSRPSSFVSEDIPARRAEDPPARVPRSLSYSLFPSPPAPRVNEDVPPRQPPALTPAARVPRSLSYSLFPSPPSPRVTENGTPHPADAPISPWAPRPATPEPKPTNNLAPVTPVAPREAEEEGSETIRFVRPSELAVQLLPGRLEVIEGATPHREIRFLRAPGEVPHIVLGRDVGVSPHYIGLGSPMVSRRHARLDFIDNRWVVKNLSRTNPLVVNDYELTEDTRPLADGDRLQLGDVVLRFYAQ